MDEHPISLAKLDGGQRLEIQWSDGVIQLVRARTVRQACPCATCREKAEALEKADQRMQLRVLSDAELQPLAIERMNPAGSYAYQIQFSDGHRSGLFPLALLRQLQDA